MHFGAWWGRAELSSTRTVTAMCRFQRVLGGAVQLATCVHVTTSEREADRAWIST